LTINLNTKHAAIPHFFSLSASLFLFTKKNKDMKICLTIALVIFFVNVSSGQKLPGNGFDRYAYMGRVIRIIPAATGGYGYSIFFQNHLVARQSLNPFTMAPTGLKNKEDALKLARWQVAHTPQPGSRAVVREKRFSRDLARELSIDPR
jgi:hypothetical protein